MSVEVEAIEWSGGAAFDWSTSPYLHLVRSPEDPAPMSRAQRMKALGRAASRDAWKGELRDASVEEWAERIWDYLDDGREVTFNRVVLDLTDYRFTADIAFEKAPDKALRQLVEEGVVEHTLSAPILFRSMSARARFERAKSTF